MNNITYTIEEPLPNSDTANSVKDISLNSFGREPYLDNYNDEIDATCSELIARQIDYDMNYTVKYLGQILEYYGFKKGKLNKKDIILKIVEFEMKSNNKCIVDTRKRLFENFIELKNDPFFSKYIVINL